MTSPPLPNFVIIGAAKAATTWLGNQLRARPDVFLPLREPHFFSREYDRGEKWYRRWFSDAAPGQLVGEKSADYLHDAAVAQRLHALLPDARVIVKLRNPVERAYSDYCMFYRRGHVSGDIRAYLDPARPSAEPRFLADSAYYQDVVRFLDYFPQDRMKILIYEDIAKDPVAIARGVEEFLGLPPLPEGTALASQANVKNAPMLPLPLRRALAPAKRWVAPLRSQGWFKALHGTLAREVTYPALPDDLRAALQAHYAEDIAQLEALLGRDLSVWTRPKPERESRAAQAA